MRNNRLLILSLITTLFFFGKASGQKEDLNINHQGKQVAINCELKDDNIDGYLLYLPESYDEKGDWPIILFLQGGALLDGEVNIVDQCGLPGLLKPEIKLRLELRSFLKDSFIVISPHMIECNTSKRQWYNNTNTINEILNDAITKYKGDSTRIYLTGLCWGGHGVWGIASKMENKFAAIVPICGALHGIENYSPIVNLPIWVTHCRGDRTVLYSESINAVNKIEELGGEKFLRLNSASPKEKEYLKHKHIFTTFEKDSHNAWTETYNKVEVYKWLLGFSTQTK